MSHKTNNKSGAEFVSRRDREKQRNREAIMEAAIHLFAHKGFNQTKLEDVAEKAEFGKGTLYNYFHSKDDLLVCSIQYALDKVLAFLEQKLTAETDPIQRLHLIVTAIFDYYHANQDILCVVMQQFRMGSRESVHAKMHEQQFARVKQLLTHEVQNAMEQNLIRTGNAERYTEYLTGMIHSQIRALNADDNSRSQTNAHELIDIFINGVTHV